jgi:hypothetical protein
VGKSALTIMFIQSHFVDECVPLLTSPLASRGGLVCCECLPISCTNRYDPTIVSSQPPSPFLPFEAPNCAPSPSFRLPSEPPFKRYERRISMGRTGRQVVDSVSCVIWRAKRAGQQQERARSGKKGVLRDDLSEGVSRPVFPLLVQRTDPSFPHPQEYALRLFPSLPHLISPSPLLETILS